MEGAKIEEQLGKIIGLLEASVRVQITKGEELQAKITALQKEVKLLKYGEGTPQNW